MKFVAARIAVDDGNTGYARFSRPPHEGIVSGLTVFPAFSLPDTAHSRWGLVLF
ncbi:hypothetical protein [Aquitalea sp. ASV11]|uniref:hypothetical protein n=1 Tax=Aquitalea sp. ASV11 TaxID=2795103 RepID=UPI0018ED8710|nr:hypothetical protein [Aquitalea sp. ASV11]